MNSHQDLYQISEVRQNFFLTLKQHLTGLGRLLTRQHLLDHIRAPDGRGRWRAVRASRPTSSRKNTVFDRYEAFRVFCRIRSI
jgi:hypothetical protein